jgi:hypothetical protein
VLAGAHAALPLGALRARAAADPSPARVRELASPDGVPWRDADAA